MSNTINDENHQNQSISIEKLLENSHILSQKKPILREYDINQKDLKLFEDSQYLSIDAEGIGLNLHRDRLCLLQICNNENIIFIHFPKPIYNCPNLVSLLNNPMMKLFHYARFDMLAIYKYLNVLCKNVICTRLLSKVARTFSDKHGLKNLLEELLHIKMNKGEQLSYWGADELSDSQKEYAKKDVVYLKPLMEKIKWMLLRENRWIVAESMCQTLPSCVLAEAYYFDPANLINYS
jgi:ribonuclease D